MAKDIKQRIVLSGEKEYRAALENARRSLKTLQTALKAETAELGKNASEQDKARVKAASLREQIAEQEKVVATLTKALQDATEQYGDNEAVVAKWEQQLNKARETLANMKNDLEGTGEGFKTAEKGAADAVIATKSFADTLENLGGIGDGVADAIETIFTGVIERITDAVGELWGVISATAAKANNWTDIAGYWGTDAQTIQEYARATEASANSFEDLQSAVSRLVLGGKGKKITELLGISDTGYKDEWQYAMDAMDMLYAKMRSGQDINPILEEIFGEKKSTKILDLLNDWGDIQQAVLTGTYNGNTSGYGMSDEELQTMNDLWVQINSIETKWNALKENFAAGFGVASMDILVNVEGALDGLAAYMNASDESEKQAALDSIRKNIEEFFRKVAELIRECVGILDDVGKDLQQSDDPLTRMVGDIFVKVSEALQWFIDNQDAVKNAFNAIFGVWALAKVAALGAQLANVVASIRVIQGFKGLGGAAAAGAGAGAAAGGSGGGWLATLLGSTAGKVAGGGAAFLTTLFGDLLRPSDPHRGEASEIDVNANGPVIIEELSEEDRADEAFKQALAEGRGTDWSGSGETAMHERRPTGELHERLDASRETIKAAQVEALEDLFDAWRNAETGTDTYEEYDRAWEYAQEILGDDFGAVMEQLIQKMDENPNWMKNGDIPLSWWEGAMNPANWNGGQTNGAMNQNGITSSDLQSFQKLPSGMQRAVEAGARAGVSGIRVDLDGASVGRLVAPYVSEYIASDMITYEY